MINEEKNKELHENNSSETKIDDNFYNDTIIQSEDGIQINEKEEKEINLGESISEDVEEEKTNKKSTNSTSSVSGAKKSDNYKYIIYLFFILLITVFVLWYNLASATGMVDENGNPIYVYQTIGSVFKEMNWWYFLLFIFFVFVCYLLSSLIIFLFARLYTRHYKYHQAYANNAIGSFYSAITPGSSGGQFAQVYTFKKQGIPVSNSASIFVMSFIISQSVLIFVGLVSLITSFDLIFSLSAIPITIGDISFSIPIWAFAIFGFALNLLVIFLLLFMSYSQKVLDFITVSLVNIFAKLRIIKNADEKRKNIRIQVENYRIELRRLQSNIPFSLLIVLLMLVNLIINQLAPFFSGLALNAFNLTDINIFQKMYDCVVFSNFHQMVTGLIPLPGSAGISEIVFASLFGQSSGYYSDEFYLRGGLNIILLVWRFGTFYIPFIINGIFAATYKSRGLSVKERIIPVGNRKTMLTIQLETYAERKASSDTIYETKALERKQMLEKIIHHDKNKKTREISISQNENIKKIEYEDKIVIGDDDEE